MADFEIIAEGTLSSDTTAITLSAIPQTYTHLELQFSGRGSYASAYPGSVAMLYNSDGGTNYGFNLGYMTSGSGAGEGYALSTQSWIGGAMMMALDSWTANVQALTSWIIPNYTSTTIQPKQAIGLKSLGDGGSLYSIKFEVAGWASTAAITSITIGNSGSSDIMAESSYWLAGWA
jgi:hypothetical protein